MAYLQARRDFLKISTTGVSASVLIPGSLGALGDVALKGEDKFIRSICEMCSSRCPMEARVVNGKTVLIQGNSFLLTSSLFKIPKKESLNIGISKVF